jgi:hypothetical protein
MEMIDICKSILGEENRGATHFISSIYLGAKVYYAETSLETTDESKISAQGGVKSTVLGGRAKLSLTEQSARSRYTQGTTATIHPAVELKAIKTVVRPEHEMVIGCEVSPIWLLVTDKVWREAMKTACSDYVRHHAATHPFPVIASGEIWNSVHAVFKFRPARWRISGWCEGNLADQGIVV